MGFDDIKSFFIVLIAFCTSALTIGGFINLVANWKKKSKVEKHDITIKNHEERIKELEKDKKEKESFARAICNSMLALLDHNINGDSRDKLESAKKELQDYLISK